MNIVQFISRADTIGGSQRHVLDLAVSLHETGHEVVVVTGPSGPFSRLLLENGVSVVEIPDLRSRPSLRNLLSDWRAMRTFSELVREIRPDVVACHSSKAGGIGRVVCWWANVRSVYTLHGITFSPGESVARRLGNWGLEMLFRPFSGAVIAVSEYDGALAIRSRIISEKRLHIVRNAVRDQGKLFRSKEKKFRMIMPARFDEPKDHALLFRALRELDHLSWQLDLVGDGPLEAELRELANAAGIADRVRFVGLVDDIGPYLHAAHMLVLISKHEGLPLAVLEGLAAGLPIVASRVGGVPEAVVDARNGYLIDVGDCSALTHALKSLMSDRASVDRMGVASRSMYEERFSYEEFFGRTQGVYRSVLGDVQAEI